MDWWAIVVIVVAVLVIAGLAFGWLKRFVARRGDTEVSIEAPPAANLDVDRSTFTDSKIKGRGGAKIKFNDTDSDGTNFDVR